MLARSLGCSLTHCALADWEASGASPLLIVTHSKHFDNCHSHRRRASAPAVASRGKERAECSGVCRLHPQTLALACHVPSTLPSPSPKQVIRNVEQRLTPHSQLLPVRQGGLREDGSSESTTIAVLHPPLELHHPHPTLRPVLWPLGTTAV